ncbi:hypothetical protein SPRG_04885 [Saprolegnia parasitica CBS 223.65]|uniref:Uncharacterized protein n=1 Tax=Saprolegnia parasitica (strain CBS 223.65) TaxID=695850 RepID=A0A067CH12_SAPPC|nr:hypothetical protein SPRG_04885 [Saprolegnia parasitica CBS 223.65]KDO29768.1 hypothetical protein SPRG_04885 [Saprolegnia parasitica CBS 223.65]|eukprot:XP_012199416.1 hypothetical protein SPRG_04885 [Saprolegnia parasitica CBS 223.65]
MPLRTYQDSGFAWRDPNNWSGDTGASIDFASSAFDGTKISVSTFGEPYAASPVLRTIRGWSGEKILYIEWTTYAQSNTNIWLLPTLLTHQFGDPRWPNCGEYDIFEMFNGGKPAGTKNYFNYGLFGQSTTHIASLQCFAPEYIASPMVSSSAAQYEIQVGVSTAMAVIFGSDDRGQYLQQIQNPVLLPGQNATFDISLSDGVIGARIYNDANHYWGFRLVLQEQYLGYFDVTNFLVLQKRT